MTAPAALGAPARQSLGQLQCNGTWTASATDVAGMGINGHRTHAEQLSEPCVQAARPMSSQKQVLDNLGLASLTLDFINGRDGQDVKHCSLEKAAPSAQRAAIESQCQDLCSSRELAWGEAGRAAASTSDSSTGNAELCADLEGCQPCEEKGCQATQHNFINWIKKEGP